jgi:segregation and condensation protein A
MSKDTIENLTQDLEVSLLVEAIQRVLANIDRVDNNREVFFQKLHREVFSVEEKMEWIESLMDTADALPFSALFSDSPKKPEIIATFLAILELLKLKKISVIQDCQFDEIQVHKKHMNE